MITLKEISKKVKMHRLKNGLTQAQLAELVDISTVHLSHIETGAVSMSLDCLLRICEVLDITPNHLLLPDFQIEKDHSLLREYMEDLTKDEKQFLLQMSSVLKEMKLNR